MYVAVDMMQIIFFLIRFGILLCIFGIGTILVAPYCHHLLENEVPLPCQKNRNEGILPIHSRRNAFGNDRSALVELGNYAENWRIRDGPFPPKDLSGQKYRCSILHFYSSH